MNMKKLLLSMLISSPCFAYWPTAQIQTIRQVEVRDLRELEYERQLKEANRRADRTANVHAQVQVVYVRNAELNFEWLTTSDKNMIKYGLFGAIICLLILRK